MYKYYTDIKNDKAHTITKIWKQKEKWNKKNLIQNIKKLSMILK